MLLWVLIAVMVLAWSGNFIIAKFTLRELPPFALLFLRVLFSNGLLLPLYLASRQHRRQPLERGDWKWFALLGLFGIALNQTGFTVGLHHTTVSHSSLIISLSPLLVLILASRMQLERFTRQKLAGMALSFAGVGVEPEVEVTPQGTIRVPAAPGLGYRVRRERIEKLTVRSEVFRAR